MAPPTTDGEDHKRKTNECRDGRHERCGDELTGPGVVWIEGQPHECSCHCHQKDNPRRSAQVDQLAEGYDFQADLDLEQALAQAPPWWLVRRVDLTWPGHHAADAVWVYLGRHGTRTPQARYGRVCCKKCAPDWQDLATCPVVVKLESHGDPTTGRRLRAGACPLCGQLYWLEVVQP